MKILTHSVIAKVNYLISQGQYSLASELLHSTRSKIHPLLLSQKTEEISKFYDNTTLYVDITDYIIFFKQRAVVSGIQRVVHSIIKYLPLTHGLSRFPICWCITHPVSGLFSLVSHQALQMLVHSIDECDERNIHLLARGIIEDATWHDTLPFTSKDILFIPGGPWATPVQLLLYARLKERLSFSIIAICYDIIPIQYPEFCAQGLVQVFERTYDHLVDITDGYVSISQYTSNQISKYESSLGRLKAPSRYLHWRLGDFDNHFAEAEYALPKGLIPFQDILESPYVLVVTTIEPRKNHTSLLRAWRLLNEQLPDGVPLPALVLAGKIGWNSSDFVEHVKALNKSNIKVLLLEGLDDLSISWLYSNCSFSIMPSFVEGWGLSIPESLMRGKLCLCSNLSSMPEAAQGICPLFDPFNIREIANLVYEYIVIGVPLHMQEKIDSYRPVSWKESIIELSGKVNSILSLDKGEQMPLARRKAAIDISPQQNKLILNGIKHERIISSYACWFPIEQQGFVRSFGTESYFYLSFDCRPLSISLFIDSIIHDQDISAIMSVNDDGNNLPPLTAISEHSRYEFKFSLDPANLVEKTLVYIKVIASKSQAVLEGHDPRLSSFILKSIEFTWN